MDLSNLVLAAIFSLILLVQLNLRLASPIIAIADRWIRWIVFPFVIARFCQSYGLIDRPLWVLAVSGFILWFLFETLYNWLAIAALSVSPYPLFPKYSINSSG